MLEFTLTDPTGLAGDKLSRTVTVTALNDDPTNAGSFPSGNLNPDEETAIGLDFGLIDLADVDHAGGDLMVRLDSGAGSGTINANPMAGITIVGNGTTTLTLEGSLADLNTYLDDNTRLSYTGATDVAGNAADTIDVEVSDQGNTGSGGGGWVALGTITVDIANINDAPTVSGGPVDLGSYPLRHHDHRLAGLDAARRPDHRRCRRRHPGYRGDHDLRARQLGLLGRFDRRQRRQLDHVRHRRQRGRAAAVGDDLDPLRAGRRQPGERRFRFPPVGPDRRLAHRPRHARSATRPRTATRPRIRTPRPAPG